MISSIAWLQAHAKLSHRVYVELNDELLIPMAYGAGDPADLPRLWRGHRLVGFDGSLLHLPKSASVMSVPGELRRGGPGAEPSANAQGR